MNLLALAPTAAGSWLIFAALVVGAENFKSKMFFKVIPFALGLASLLTGLKLFGVL